MDYDKFICNQTKPKQVQIALEATHSSSKKRPHLPFCFKKKTLFFLRAHES